jgi:hypothetical protein
LGDCYIGGRALSLAKLAFEDHFRARFPHRRTVVVQAFNAGAREAVIIKRPCRVAVNQ